MALTAYSARDVRIVWNDIIVDGLAAETFLDIEYVNPVSETVNSAKGDFQTVSILFDRQATVTLTLQQNSPAHRLFMTEYNNFIDQVGSQGIGSLAIDAGNGAGGFDSYRAEQAYIETFPNLVYANGQTDREWVIKAANLLVTLG